MDQCMKGHEKTWKLSEVNFYVYAWPFIHCLYFIEACKVYVLTHLKVRDSGNAPLPIYIFDSKGNPFRLISVSRTL